jgi:HEAT repeat protein
VIPLLLGASAKDLHPSLSGLHALDFTDARSRPWSELFSTLQSLAASSRSSTVRKPRGAPVVIIQAARGIDSLVSAERLQAIDTLQQMQHPAAIEVLAGALQHPVREVRIEAALVLSRAKDVRALPELLEAIRTPAVSARKGQQTYEIDEWILARIGPAAAPELIHALRDPKGSVQAVAARALAKIGDPSAIPALVQALEDGSDSVRSVLVRCLADFGERAPRAVILNLLRDDSGTVREAAAVAVRQLGGREAVDALVAALSDPEPNVRHEVVKQLGQMKDGSAVPALVECLRRDTYLPARLSAAGSLAKIKDRSAVPSLAEAAQDDSEWLRGAAFDALAEIGGPETVKALLAVLAAPENRGSTRARAAYDLGRLADRSAVPGLLRGLRDEDAAVRRYAAEALAAIGDAAAVPALIAALQDEDKHVRAGAAGALETIGTPEAKAAAKAWRRAQSAGA